MKLSFALAAALFLPILVDARPNPILNHRATTAAPAGPSNPVTSTPQANSGTPLPPSVPQTTVVPSPPVPTTSSERPPSSQIEPTTSIPHPVPTSTTKTTSISTVVPTDIVSSSSSVRTTSTSSSSTSSKKVTTTSTSSSSTSSTKVTTTSTSSKSTTTTASANSTSSLAWANSTSSIAPANSTSSGPNKNAPKTVPSDSTSSSAKAKQTPKPTTTTTKAGQTPSQGEGQPSNTGSAPPPPPPTPTCPLTDTCVQVSPDGQINYDPSNFGASNGTVVTFVFPPNSGSHSVTQGNFNNPCVYMTAEGGNAGGFDSGLQNGKLFSIQITNDQQPIYFFSKDAKVCGQGMVGAINPPATGNTYDAYAEASKTLGPNQDTLVDGGPVLGGVGAEAQGTPSPIPSPPPQRSSSSHLIPNSFFALLATVFGIALA